MKLPSNYKVLSKGIFPNQYIVSNSDTGVIGVMKSASVYGSDIYDYLKSHKSEHIPEIYNTFKTEEGLIVVEEYVQGILLRDFISNPDTTDKNKRDILLQICDGLAFLHSAPNPIIHRDLRMDNIIITSDGRAVIMDYDAARTFKEGKDSDTFYIGTPENAAPEQFGFAQSDPRTDIYAVGKIIELMFPGNNSMLVIARKATNVDMNRRYKTAAYLKRALKSGQKGHSLFPLPGFRQGILWHKFIAIPAYALVLMIYCGSIYTSRFIRRWPVGRWIFYFIEVGVILYTYIDIFFDWCGPWCYLPGLNINRAPLRKIKSPGAMRFVRVLFGLIYGLAFWGLIRLVNAYVPDYFFPYIN